MDALLKRKRIIVRPLPGPTGQVRRCHSPAMLCLTAVLLASGSARAQERDARVAELDRKLDEAQTQAQALQQMIAALATELRALKEPAAANDAAPAGAYSRIGIDYQFKTRVTANDDSLNRRLQVSWNVEK